MTATTQFITIYSLNETFEFFLIKCTRGQERIVDTSVLRVTECCFQVRLVPGGHGRLWLVLAAGQQQVKLVKHLIFNRELTLSISRNMLVFVKSSKTDWHTDKPTILYLYFLIILKWICPGFDLWPGPSAFLLCQQSRSAVCKFMWCCTKVSAKLLQRTLKRGRK